MCVESSLLCLKRYRPTGCPASCPVGRQTSPESSGFTCFRKRCVRSPEYCWRSSCVTPRSSLLQVLGTKEYSLPHTVFSSAVSLGPAVGTVKFQLDRT